MKLSALKKKILLALLKQYRSNRYAPSLTIWGLADKFIGEDGYYVTSGGCCRLKHSIYVSVRRSIDRLLKDELICVEKQYPNGVEEPRGPKYYILTRRGLTTARALRSEICKFVEEWGKLVGDNR